MSWINNAKNRKESIAANLTELTTIMARALNNPLKEGQFEAVILTNMHIGSAGKVLTKLGKFDFFKIRALDDSDAGLDSPFTAPHKITEEDFFTRVNRHRAASFDSESKGNAGNKFPAPGQVWLCRYMKKRYRGMIVLDHFIRDHPEVPYIGSKQSLQNSINSGNSALLGRSPKAKTGDAWKFLKALEWVEYGLLSGGLTAMLDNIGRNESGEGGRFYNDFNCGAPHSLDSCEAAVVEEFGFDAGSRSMSDPSKSLSNRTIKFIMEKQAKSIVLNSSKSGSKGGTEGPAPNAVGKYKFVPNTMRWLTQLFRLDTAKKFDKLWQDTGATYLILSKRPLLGGYLVDLHDDSSLAAHELAKEWSAFPSQYTMEEEIDGKKYNCVAGKSIYYLIGGGYASKMTTHAAKLFVENWKTEFQAFLQANPAAKALVETGGS